MKRFLFALAGLVSTVAIAAAASIPLISGPQDPSQLNATINTLIQQINSLITPQTMANFATPRNLLDNGQMQVQQRGTATRTCAQNAGITTAAYAADRWACSVNVASGAGTLQVITSNLPASPVFNAGMVFYRTSGVLTQPQCVMQEIPTATITPLQGSSVTLSVYIQGLANMLAESTTVNAYLFTGTGSDEGLGSVTASPAITPAWTGIASSQTAAFTITSSWARYSTTFSVGSTVTEAAVALCWTPTAGGTAGTTDGFRFTGVQLEQGNAASAFEFRRLGEELAIAQRYLNILTEPAAGVQVPVTGNSTSATAAAMAYSFPVTMRVAPTFTALGTALSTSTWTNKCGNVNNALATTFVVTATANTVSGASLTVTSSGSTIGFGCVLTGAGGGSILSWSADF